MAHECPHCGLCCYCGGDIDDCTFRGTRYEANCQCCEGICDECGEPEYDCMCDLYEDYDE